MAKRESQTAGDSIETAEGVLSQLLKDALVELRAIRSLLEHPKDTAVKEASNAGRHNPPAQFT